MRACPKCGELNGDSNVRCYKCNTFIGTLSKSKKKCPNCGRIYADSKSDCENCGNRLVIFDEEYSYQKKESNTWMYILTILFPLIGLILGFIKFAKEKNSDTGKNLIILSVILTLIYLIIICSSYSCSQRIV